MGDKFAMRVLLGACLASAICTPALNAIGAWATLADAMWLQEGSQEGATIPYSVGATGDFNNDGYADIVLGTHLYSYDPGTGPIYRSGGAWLFYGSDTGPSATPDLFIAPPYLNSNGYFGQSVATGNFDGDDYDDLVIGLTNYDQTNSDEGAAYVYYGSDTGLDGSYDWMARGGLTFAHFGMAVASAGDIDNDGFDDLIVGARRYDSCNGALPIVNHAYVFLGSVTGLGANKTAAQADWYAMGDQCVPNDDAAFGTNVGSAGDLNGDGYGDIFVGAPLYDAGHANEGKIFVWYGSDTGLGDPGTPANADWTAEGDQTDARLGTTAQTAVAAGDFDGDGYDDLIAGARLYDLMETNDGLVLVWYGSDTGLGAVDGDPVNNDWLAYGALGNDQLGANVRVFDYNGDRFDDVLLGGIGHPVGGNNGSGMAVIYLGSEAGLGAQGPSSYADWMVEGDQLNSYFGWSMSAGDTDGDDLEDIVVGAPYYDLTNADAGKVWAFQGEPTVFIENFETGDTDRCSYMVE